MQGEYILTFYFIINPHVIFRVIKFTSVKWYKCFFNL